MVLEKTGTWERRVIFCTPRDGFSSLGYVVIWIIFELSSLMTSSETSYMLSKQECFGFV